MRQQPAESDLFSYLLFDGDFVEPLAELGFGDAAAQEEELVGFIEDWNRSFPRAANLHAALPDPGRGPGRDRRT